jgi:hypothetical protein
MAETRLPGDYASTTAGRVVVPIAPTYVAPTIAVTSAGVVPRDTLAKSATKAEDRQKNYAAEGTTLPIVYGYDVCTGKVAGIISTTYDLWVLVIWCAGEVDGIFSVTMNGDRVPPGVRRYDRLGTSTQTVITEFKNACASVGIAYNDTMPGACYSAFRVTNSDTDAYPEFTAVIKGKKVATSSGGTPTWSDNPAYCLADFVESTTYGMGRAIDWTTVATAAAACDATISGQRRRTLNLSLIQEQFVDQWLDTLRAYAGCWVLNEGGEIKLLPDTTGSAVYAFDASNIVDGSVRVQKAGVSDIPTVMRITYTDTSATPYRDAEAVAYAPGALAGTTPWRESSVPLPGINRYSQAYREAVERLNALTLSDLTVSWACFDVGLALQVGDIVTVTHAIGLTAKEVRLTSITDRGFGRYDLVGAEYDPAIYSDVVVAEPTTVDSGLSIAGTPPTLTGLSAAEEIYRTGDGLISSRLRITWTDPEWPNTLNYLVTITDAGTLVHQGTAWDEIYVTPALQEGKTYGIGVRVISRAGVAGEEATTAQAMVGKIGTLPGDVPSLTCTEVAGKVYARWTAASDLDTLDYEIRYGAASVTWAAATYVQRISSLAYTIEGITSGTYDFLIKARDSYKQESANATRASGVVITSDTAAPQLGSREMTAPTLVDMAASGGGWDTVDTGDWSAGYTGDNWDSNSRSGNAWNNPTGSTGSSWTSEAWDIGMSVAATVTTDLDTTDIIGGPSVIQIGYSTSTSVVASMTWVTALTVDATVRYLRVRATMGSGGAMSIAGPVSINYSGFTV